MSLKKQEISVGLQRGDVWNIIAGRSYAEQRLICNEYSRFVISYFSCLKETKLVCKFLHYWKNFSLLIWPIFCLISVAKTWRGIWTRTVPQICCSTKRRSTGSTAAWDNMPWIKQPPATFWRLCNKINNFLYNFVNIAFIFKIITPDAEMLVEQL